MKKLMTLLLSGIVCFSLFGGCASKENETTTKSITREITDMAGRKVTIPTNIDKVYCAVPTAESMVCTLVPEKMVAWVNKPADDAKKYLNKKTIDLPAIGGWMGQQVTANMEDIIKISPDVVIYMTVITDITGSTPGDSTADQIQEQTGKPVIVMDSSFDKMSECYKLLGDYLGVKERGEKLAKYCDDKKEEITNIIDKIPEDKKVDVYYAEGKGGLSTDPAGSPHTEVLDFVQVKNVAAVDIAGGQGMTQVSMEQVLKWNPSLILVSASNQENYEEIMSNPSWSKINAVENKKIYLTPAVPFNWFDRPPNIMRILGIQWAANLFYPEYAKIDIKKEIKEFFSLFYNVELSDEEAAAFISK